jgi:hypothetical protein
MPSILKFFIPSYWRTLREHGKMLKRRQGYDWAAGRLLKRSTTIPELAMLVDMKVASRNYGAFEGGIEEAMLDYQNLGWRVAQRESVPKHRPRASRINPDLF